MLANGELRLCHYQAARFLTVKGPARIIVSVDGVSVEAGKAVVSSDTCGLVEASAHVGGLVARGSQKVASSRSSRLTSQHPRCDLHQAAGGRRIARRVAGPRARRGVERAGSNVDGPKADNRADRGSREPEGCAGAGRCTGLRSAPCPAREQSGTVDPWGDATGDTLMEQIASVGDHLLVALATYRAAVQRWPHAKITLRNRARVIEQSWED